MRTKLFILTLCVWTTVAFAQDQKFVTEMERALHIHDTTSTFDGEIEALAQFKRLSEKYESEWLAPYWTSYLLTQIGRLVGRTNRGGDPLSYIDNAQEYLDRASALLPNKTAEQKSDFHALQTLIYTFKAQFHQGAEAVKFRDLRDEELEHCIKTNPQNPLGYVLAGTSLIGEGAGQSELRKVLAGRVLLLEAQELFDKNRRPERSMTTHWNSEWLPFWLPYSERLLKGQAN